MRIEGYKFQSGLVKEQIAEAVREAKAEAAAKAKAEARKARAEAAKAKAEAAKAKAEALLKVLESRKIRVDRRLKREVLACRDTDRLDAWFDKALKARSLADVFE